MGRSIVCWPFRYKTNNLRWVICCTRLLPDNTCCCRIDQHLCWNSPGCLYLVKVHEKKKETPIADCALLLKAGPTWSLYHWTVSSMKRFHLLKDILYEKHLEEKVRSAKFQSEWLKDRIDSCHLPHPTCCSCPGRGSQFHHSTADEVKSPF